MRFARETMCESDKAPVAPLPPGPSTHGLCRIMPKIPTVESNESAGPSKGATDTESVPAGTLLHAGSVRAWCAECPRTLTTLAMSKGLATNIGQAYADVSNETATGSFLLICRTASRSKLTARSMQVQRARSVSGYPAERGRFGVISQ